MISSLQTKGLEKIDHEIMLSPISHIIGNYHTIIICKYIIGKSKSFYSEKELNEKEKEK